MRGENACMKPDNSEEKYSQKVVAKEKFLPAEGGSI